SSGPAALGFLLELDVGLESVQVAAHCALDEAQPATRFVDQVVGLHVHGHLEAGQAVAELVEGDDASMREPLGDVPFDPFVGTLLQDFGLDPLLYSPALCLGGGWRG